MKKIFIILSGVYIFLLGLLSLALIALMFFVPSSDDTSKVTTALTVIPFYGLLGIWCIASAIGIFLSKSWARISLLVMSGLALFAGATTIFSVWFILPNTLTQTPSEHISIPQIQMFIITFNTIFFIAIPLFFIIFFNAKAVKSVFCPTDENTLANGEKKLPLGIKIIAIYYLISVAGIIFTFSQPDSMEFPLVGNSVWISGNLLKIYSLFISLINLYIGYGFLKLKKAAWTTAICLQGALFVLGVFNTLTQTQATINRLIPQYSSPPAVTMPLSTYQIFGALGSALSLVVLVYVYRKKQLFVN